MNGDTALLACSGLETSIVVTSVTWRSRQGLTFARLSPRVVAGQIDSAARQHIQACTIGSLSSPEIVRVVMQRLKRRSVPNLVLHPAIFSHEGDRILSHEGVVRLRKFLPGLACLVADLPNARALAPGPSTPPTDPPASREIPPGSQGEQDAAEVARRLVHAGVPFAIVRIGGPGGIDIVYDGMAMQTRPSCKGLHASSGSMAAAIAGGMARGLPAPQAYDEACRGCWHLEPSLPFPPTFHTALQGEENA